MNREEAMKYAKEYNVRLWIIPLSTTWKGETLHGAVMLSETGSTPEEVIEKLKPKLWAKN